MGVQKDGKEGPGFVAGSLAGRIWLKWVDCLSWFKLFLRWFFLPYAGSVTRLLMVHKQQYAMLAGKEFVVSPALRAPCAGCLL